MVSGSVVTVQYGTYGSIIWSSNGTTGEPTLITSTLNNCGALQEENLYKALTEVFHLYPDAQISLPADRELVKNLMNVQVLSLGLVGSCYATQVPGNWEDCMNQHDSCRASCDAHNCNQTGCNTGGLSLCYNMCSMELTSCGVCAILCPWKQ
jgi:hypothetical protein